MFLLISEVSPAQLRAFSISLSAAVATTAGIAAPTVTGWFVASAPRPDGYTAAFLCCAALMVLGGAAALVINPQRDAPDQPGT